jgi:hypothetical protein
MTMVDDVGKRLSGSIQGEPAASIRAWSISR